MGSLVTPKLVEDFFERVAIRMHEGEQSEAKAVWGAWGEFNYLKPEGGWPPEIQTAVRKALAILQGGQPQEPAKPAPVVAQPKAKPEPPPQPKPVAAAKPKPVAEKPKAKSEEFPW